MNLVTHGTPGKQHTTPEHARSDGRGRARRCIPQWLLLIALAGASFGVTYALVIWSRGPAAPPADRPPGMVWIPGGEFTMGTNSELGWPDEKPAHRVSVKGFWMDETEVTNAQFRRFVETTGYVTTAERVPALEEIMNQLPPGSPAPAHEMLVAGSLVFTKTAAPVNLEDYSQWWKWTPGASWRHPEGPGSSLEGRDNHPVVQVSWDDAAAYANWAGKRLPSEAEWEFAARGGLENRPYVWGDENPAGNGTLANLWQGEFPVKNSVQDGHERTAPVRSFAPNGFGLFDMAGNVWEWCADAYDRDAYARRAGSNVISNPLVDRSFDPRNLRSASRAQRGGSFLCHDAYCSRYRPGARHGCAPDTGMSHVGFRCVMKTELRAEHSKTH